MKVLDTDVCIEILRGNDQVRQRRGATLDRVATTWITACELAYGAANSRYPDRNQASALDRAYKIAGELGSHEDILALLPVVSLPYPLWCG